MNGFIELLRNSATTSAATWDNAVPMSRHPAMTGAPLQPTAIQANTGRGKSRLLIVDDEPALCDLLAIYFRHHGLEVITAHSAAEGSALINNQRFDIAILDLSLDGTPAGLDLLDLWQSKYPKKPAIIFTGHADFYGVEKRLAGRVPVLHKSGPLHVLCDEVKRQCHS